VSLRERWLGRRDCDSLLGRSSLVRGHGGGGEAAKGLGCGLYGDSPREHGLRRNGHVFFCFATYFYVHSYLVELKDSTNSSNL